MGGSLSFDTTLSLHEFATRLSAQITAADSEIDETRAILKDAIDRLIPAFVGREDAGRGNGSAFSALQFQDLSDQQLAHAQERLRALCRQLSRLQAALDPAGPLIRDGAGATALVELVAEANDALTSLDLTLAKPVATPHLGTGDMELF